MPYLSRAELEALGFKYLGRDVLISTKASIYGAQNMEIGDRTRIDDFCVLSGRIKIGKNVHIAVFCNVAGGEPGIVIEDFAGLAYGCHVFAQSDDYSGRSMTNPTVPDRFKHETKKPVIIGRHSIVGTMSIIFPGVVLGEGTAVGAHSVVTKSTEPWGIYVGYPARKIKARSKELLEMEKQYLRDIGELV